MHTVFKKTMGELSLFSLEKRIQRRTYLKEGFKGGGAKFSLVIMAGGKTFSKTNKVQFGRLWLDIKTSIFTRRVLQS